MAQVKVETDGKTEWVEGVWWAKSWTLWLNIVAFLIPVLEFVTGSNFLPLDPQMYALLLALLNFLLRFKTKQPVTLEK